MSEKKKRIILFGEFPPPPGGIAQQALILLNCLENEGLVVSSCPSNAKLPRFLSFVNRIKVFRTICKLPFIYLHFLFHLLNSDVVHIFSNSYGNFYLYTSPPLLLAKIFRKRVIINYHGGAAADFFKRDISWVKPFLNLADSITVPSQFLKDIFSLFGIHVKIISNIAHLERFSFYKRESFSPTFIVTRHLEPEYGIDIVLKAFKEIITAFPEATLIVAGYGSRAKSLMTLAQDLGISSKVSFVGEFDNRELPKLYSQADIFINASRVDNFPVSIIEAFASGLPVISTRAGGIPYIVEHKVTGLLADVNDSNALAELAKKLLSDSYLATSLARNARRFVEPFTWQNVRIKLFEVYGIDLISNDY